jgi:hypothetical protein
MVEFQKLPPRLMFVRAITTSPPFAAGDTISIAFDDETVGTLLRHDRDVLPPPPATSFVPSTFSARVTIGAEPYVTGELLTLSFVDARFAHIHRPGGAASRSEDDPTAEHEAIPALALEHADMASPLRDATVAVPQGRETVVHTEWTVDRTRRFVHVVDKLFTIERLGWYRHVLAMRLLVPDRIECGDATVCEAAATALRTLQAAATETLGRPLLAAFMPNFSVTPEWLDSIETAALASAIAALRNVVIPHAAANADVGRISATGIDSVGMPTARELAGEAVACADAFLAALLPARAENATLSGSLEAYRSSLVDAFRQTSRSIETVRLGRMSEPNHVLDDRLWQLVGVVSETFGGLAVA